MENGHKEDGEDTLNFLCSTATELFGIILTESMKKNDEMWK